MKRRLTSIAAVVALLLLSLMMTSACSDDEIGEQPNERRDTGSDAGADVGPTTCTTHDDCSEGQYCELELACGSGECVEVFEPAIEPGTMYDEWDSWPCLVDSCNCAPSADPLWHGLMKCEPVHNGFYWNFGSVELRVMGRNDDGQCVVEISEILEGGVQQQTCRLDFPIEPWPGLSGDYSLMSPFFDGFPGECDEPTSCCRLDGCPNPCDEEEVESLVCFRFPLQHTPCQ